MTKTETRPIHWVTLRFADPSLEQAFVDEQSHKLIKPFRAAMALSAGISLLIWVSLGYVLSEFPNVQSQFAGPIFAVVAVVALGFAWSYLPSFLKHQQSINLAGVWMVGAILVGMFGLLPNASNVAQALLFLVACHILNAYTIIRLRFPLASIGGWGTAFIFLIWMLDKQAPLDVDFFRSLSILAIANLFGMITCYQHEQSMRREFVALRMLGHERQRSERLLLNVLPEAIALRLKSSEESIADHCDAVTVLFADIVGFTPLSTSKSPQELVRLLDRIFSEFDTLADCHGLEKIKTIGDAYMAAAGVPKPSANHGPAAAWMALDTLDAINRVAAETGESLSIRIGLHSGPVVAGVIGSKKFIYDMWGDTVNTASRMESHGLPNRIQCSEATMDLLGDRFCLSYRGPIQIQGKGEMKTYFIDSARNQ
jgi:class 3 adenylate cyclase